MILDQQLIFSDVQTIALGASTFVSTNTIDLGAPSSIPLEAYAMPAVTGAALTPIYDIGRGTDVDLLVQIVSAATSAGAATLKVDLISSDTSNLATPTILASSAVIPYASLVVGYQFRFGNVPPGITQRYLGVQYTIGTAAISAGAVTAALVIDKQTSTSIG